MGRGAGAPIALLIASLVSYGVLGFVPRVVWGFHVSSLICAALISSALIQPLQEVGQESVELGVALSAGALGAGALGYMVWKADPFLPVILGFAICLGVVRALTWLEGRRPWANARRFHAAAHVALWVGTASAAFAWSLSAGEVVEPRLRKLYGTAFEDLKGGIQILVMIAVAGGFAWLIALVSRHIARGQLEGRYAAKRVSEATWFFALMSGLYPQIFTLSLHGTSSSIHVFQTSSIAGVLGSIAFVYYALMDAPVSAEPDPLVIVLPEFHPSRRLRDIAARVAHEWGTAGPVTLIGYPEEARELAGVHSRLAVSLGTTDVLFPAQQLHLERYRSSLPPVAAWRALPHRECFPGMYAWGDALRALCTETSQLLVLLGDSVMSEGVLTELETCVPTHRAVVGAYTKWPRAEFLSGHARRVDDIDGLSPRDAAAALFALVRGATAPNPQREIIIVHEPEDAEIARAIAASVSGRRDRARVRVWARALPSHRGWVRRMLEASPNLRGSLSASEAITRRVLKREVWPEALRTVYAGLIPASSFAKASSQLVVLERPPQAEGDATIRFLSLIPHEIIRAFGSVVAVRVGRPFAKGDTSVVGATAHAGWIATDADTAQSVREVAVKLLSNTVESFSGATEPPRAEPEPVKEALPEPDTAARVQQRSSEPKERKSSVGRRIVIAFVLVAVAVVVLGILLFDVKRVDPPVKSVPSAVTTVPSVPTPPPSPSADAGRVPATAPSAANLAQPEPTATVTVDWGDVKQPNFAEKVPTPGELIAYSGSGPKARLVHVIRRTATVLPAGIEWYLASNPKEVVVQPSSLKLSTGQNRSLTVTLLSRDGLLAVEGIAFDELRVQGAGNLPTGWRGRLPPGTYVVTPANAGLVGWSQKVTIRSGETTALVVPSRPVSSATVTGTTRPDETGTVPKGTGPGGETKGPFCHPDSKLSAACEKNLTITGFAFGCVPVKAPSGKVQLVKSYIRWFAGATECLCVAVPGATGCEKAAE